jgi:rod shape-determining protein MreC
MLLGKHRVIRRRAIVGLLLAASLTLLTLSFRQGSDGVTGGIHRGALSLTGPASRIVHRVVQPVVDGWNWTTGLINARGENERLKAQLRNFGAMAVRYQNLQEQNANFARLLHYQQAVPFETVGASLISQSYNLYTRTIQLDVGSDQGVAVNDPVVAPAGSSPLLAGLIGRVSLVSPETCTVTLIVDKNSSVWSRVLGSSAKGLVQLSSGDPNELSMELVGKDEVVQNGQVVETASFTTRPYALLPADIPIGTITSVSQNDLDQYKTIQVTPYVDFTSISDVLVLKVKR